MSTHHLPHDSPWLLALLAALVSLGPLSIDMYLPAMPAMLEFFATDITGMHLTISVYLVGFSLFHLACGPLADRYGRKPVLLGGSILFVIACIGCSYSDTVEELLFYRFFQGVGVCVGPTLARTITRDIFGPTRAARALSLIAMLMALAPAIAPTLGGIMLLVLPWSSIFVFLGCYGALVIFLVQRYLPESLPVRQSLKPAAILRNYGELLASKQYVTVTLAGGLTYAGMITYLSSSSFIFIEMLGVPVQYYGLIFLSTVLGYMTGSALSARLSGRLNSETLILIGTALALAAAFSMLVSSQLFPSSIWAIMVPMTFFTTALGLVLPHAMTIALRPFAHIAGTASALLGFIQMTLSAIASAIVGVILTDTPLPMILTMILISVIALGLAIQSYRTSTNPE
jgi:DHA1 family bicyclomycin/chloramphenicol resistance-like MFS transporter